MSRHPRHPLSSIIITIARYGIALAALGMLATLSCGLTIDGFGPISDNAGGIADTLVCNETADGGRNGMEILRSNMMNLGKFNNGLTVRPKPIDDGECKGYHPLYVRKIQLSEIF